MDNEKSVLMFPKTPRTQENTPEKTRAFYMDRLNHLVDEAQSLAHDMDLEARDVIIDMLYTQFSDELIRSINQEEG